MSLLEESRAPDITAPVITERHESQNELPNEIHSQKSSDSQINGDNFPKFADMSFGQISSILLSLSLATSIFSLEETVVATSVSVIGRALDAKGSLAWISVCTCYYTFVSQYLTRPLDWLSDDPNRSAAHCGPSGCQYSAIIGRVFIILMLCFQDIVGAKRLLIIVIWIFIAGNLISGLSNSMELLVAGRLIAGVGAAGILSLVVIIISC